MCKINTGVKVYTHSKRSLRENGMQAGSVDVESCWKAMELDEKAVGFGDYRWTKPEFASVAGGTRTVRKGPSFACLLDGE